MVYIQDDVRIFPMDLVFASISKHIATSHTIIGNKTNARPFHSWDMWQKKKFRVSAFNIYLQCAGSSAHCSVHHFPITYSRFFETGGVN